MTWELNAVGFSMDSSQAVPGAMVMEYSVGFLGQPGDAFEQQPPPQAMFPCVVLLEAVQSFHFLHRSGPYVVQHGGGEKVLQALLIEIRHSAHFPDDEGGPQLVLGKLRIGQVHGVG